MKTIKLSSAALIILCMCTAGILRAQENEVVQRRTAQFTFFYPLGSSGIESPQFSNSFSFNAIAGINGGVHGAEIGGVLNYNHGSVSGAQIVGVANINRTDTRGAMIAGVINYSGSNSGGLQLSTLNIASGYFTGFQLGVINYARTLNGVQLGVINVVENGDKALPIGLINVVKNGHYEFEVTASEMLTANLNYKMGVERLYTIFKLAYVANQGDPLYSAGVGLGSMIALHGRHNLNIDASISQLYNKHTWEEQESHFLAKLDLNYKYRLTEHFSLLAGPGYSLYGTNTHVTDDMSTVHTPSSFYSKETSKGKISMWLGFNVGLSIIL